MAKIFESTIEEFVIGSLQKRRGQGLLFV